MPLPSVSCFLGLDLLDQAQAIYEVLYDAADDPSLTPPDCFKGQDLRDQLTDIYAALLAIGGNLEGQQYYVDDSVLVSGDGLTWETAWKTIGDIDNPVDRSFVNFATGNYDANGWQPTGGSSASIRVTYRVAQDGTHTGPVNFNAAGTQFINGAVSNFNIDGRFGSQKLFIIDPAFQYVLFDPGGDDHMENISILGCVAESLIYCYGWGIEVAYNTLNSPNSGLDDSLIQHLGDDDPSPTWGKNSIHHNVITVIRAKEEGLGWDAIKWGQGVDCYNNDIIAVFDETYAGSQHNDAIQASGNYWRVYNNYFENFLSYVFLNEIFDSSDAHGYRLFNNVMFYADESGVDWGAQATWAFGGNGGTTASASLTDLICANNLTISLAANTRGGFFCHLYPAIEPPVGADCYFINNAANAFSPITQVGAGVVSNNVSDPSVGVSVNVALYPAGNFRPTAESTSLIDTGLNPAPAYLLAAFTTDADGFERTNPWSCGAYIADFPPPSSVTDTFSLLPDSSNFSDISPAGWTVNTGDFRTGSGGTSHMVTSFAASTGSIASYEPDGFTTADNHTVEVTMGPPAGAGSSAQGCACAIQPSGESYHVFWDAGNSAHFGYMNNSGTGSDYVTIAGIANVSKLRLVVSGIGVTRVCTASYDNGSGYITPPTWTNRDFGVGKRLDAGKGGLAGFNNSAAQYVDSITITNN